MAVTPQTFIRYKCQKGSLWSRLKVVLTQPRICLKFHGGLLFRSIFMAKCICVWALFIRIETQSSAISYMAWDSERGTDRIRCRIWVCSSEIIFKSVQFKWPSDHTIIKSENAGFSEPTVWRASFFNSNRPGGANAIAKRRPGSAPRRDRPN